MVFLTIARLLQDKGYKEFVEAARKVRAEYPEMEFKWLGAPDDGYPERIPLEQVMSDHNSSVIEYLGYADNVKPHIRMADCIVLPSYHEGMSRTLLEGLAMGKPIITTDIPGCKETVEHGVNGYLCVPRDASSLAEAIKMFIRLDTDTRIDMGRKSRMKAEAHFDVRHVIPVYESLIGKAKTTK